MRRGQPEPNEGHRAAPYLYGNRRVVAAVVGDAVVFSRCTVIEDGTQPERDEEQRLGGEQDVARLGLDEQCPEESSRVDIEENKVDQPLNRSIEA